MYAEGWAHTETSEGNTLRLSTTTPEGGLLAQQGRRLLWSALWSALWNALWNALCDALCTLKVGSFGNKGGVYLGLGLVKERLGKTREALPIFEQALHTA